MKLHHILISSFILIFAHTLYLEYKAMPTKSHKISIVKNKGGERHQHPNGQRLFAHPPFPVRKRWFATMHMRRIWLKTKRVIKNGKLGRKSTHSHKQSMTLKKIAFNPA